VGRHDFTAFSNAKSNKKSMVREITAISIEAQEGLVKIRVSGNGFLYNMVRKMVGSLVAVGLGDMEADAISDILTAKERSRTGPMAEACGLFLERVSYEAL
jgi:tRNA pseudouridine38-40 synthase